MNLKELYKSHLNYWPKEIDVSDFTIIKGDEFRGDSIRSQNLWNMYEKIQDRVKNDEWHCLASWVYYVVLHSKLKKFLNKNNNDDKIIILSDVLEEEFKQFSKIVLEHLYSDDLGYEEMLEEYLGNN